MKEIMMRNVVLSSVLVLIVAAVVACSGGKEAVGSPCQETVKNSCTKCHSTERICEELGKAGADWPEIVKDMGKRGKLTDEVQASVLDCLTKTTEQGKFECTK